MLHIDLYSFGYHKTGIPENRFGHGGGFVFDCRFLPNPGREVRFIRSTGLDDDVREYLASLPVTASFMGHAMALIEQAAVHYTERGFEHLQVSFGCTGGQHRSVFCAEYVARLLQDNGYSVQVTHVERERWV